MVKMTARKKAARKKTAGKGATRKSALTRLEDKLPASLRDYAKRVNKQLNALERDVERAIPQARRRTARLIREASHKLGAIEARGEKAWRGRADHMTRDAQKLLRRLEKAVAPAPRKRAAKKKGAAKRTASKAVTGS
jgi:hypothetical protein